MAESAMCFSWPTSELPATVEAAPGAASFRSISSVGFCASPIRQEAVFSLPCLDKTSGCIHRPPYACKNVRSSLTALSVPYAMGER